MFKEEDVLIGTLVVVGIATGIVWLLVLIARMEGI